MPITDKNRKELADFDAERVYTEAELEDFDRKIQRFYEPIKNQSTGETYMRLNHDKLGVAFGALREVKGSNGVIHYQATHDRYVTFASILRQHDRWRATRDAKKEYAQKKEDEERQGQSEEQPPF